MTLAEIDAYVRLVTTAPELLNQLKYAHAWLESIARGDPIEDDPQALAKMADAIAKAEGQS